jgi:hypothetical protein
MTSEGLWKAFNKRRESEPLTSFDDYEAGWKAAMKHHKSYCDGFELVPVVTPPGEKPEYE